MLAATHRFIVHNNETSVTLDFSTNAANESATVTYKGKKPTSSAGISYGSEQSQSASTDIINGGTEALTTIDNTTDNWFGIDGVFEVVTDNASADGDVVLLHEISTDGGTTWPSAAADWDPDTDADVVAVLTLGGAETVSTSFEI